MKHTFYTLHTIIPDFGDVRKLTGYSPFTKEKYENIFKVYYTYEKGKNYTFLLIKIENVDLYKNQIKIW